MHLLVDQTETSFIGQCLYYADCSASITQADHFTMPTAMMVWNEQKHHFENDKNLYFVAPNIIITWMSQFLFYYEDQIHLSFLILSNNR